MATTTPNFGWPVPTSTDLVKDGATAIEALGDSIDASLLDLKGGTTGQVLSKTTGTDMDFTWVTSDDANAIQNSIVDAKGDLIAATANDTPARLAVGANDLVLSAASGEATGLKYAGAWTSYTPSFTNLTVGNGTLVGRYCQVGKIVTASMKLTFGSTTAITGGFVLMDAPILGVVNGRLIGTLYMEDVGVIVATGWVKHDNPLYVALIPGTSSGTYTGIANMSASVPFTFATGDFMEAFFSYEAA